MATVEADICPWCKKDLASHKVEHPDTAAIIVCPEAPGVKLDPESLPEWAKSETAWFPPGTNVWRPR